MQLDHREDGEVNSIKPIYQRRVLNNHTPQRDRDFLLVCGPFLGAPGSVKDLQLHKELLGSHVYVIINRSSARRPAWLYFPERLVQQCSSNPPRSLPTLPWHSALPRDPPHHLPRGPVPLLGTVGRHS